MMISKPNQKGFTLVEMAVVIAIVGLLLGGMLLPISAQMDMEGLRTTNNRLDEIKEALIGYAIINGRLPCPASSTSNGVESLVGAGTCANPYDGFVPAVTLGITPTDSAGYALDGWSANTYSRIHYAVTIQNTSAFTTANGMSNTGMSSLSPDLHVCSSGNSVTSTTCGTTAITLTASAVAVVYSVGKNGGSSGTSTDEAQNPNPNSANNDIVFVSHDSTPTFDDQMTWISFPVLANRMVAAGKLP